MKTRKASTTRLVESAQMLAIATVLSLFSFSSAWLLGGGITFCSMLPLVIVSWRYGLGWGTVVAVLHGAIQMLIGLSNVQYADSVGTAVLIILLDYILAFGVIGLASMFRGRLHDTRREIILGIVVTFLLRLVCHYFSGVLVWEILFPNEYGWAAPVWSIAYNAGYMIPEIIITSVASYLSYGMLEKFYRRKDLS